MTAASEAPPRRRQARMNYARILEAARQELSRDPTASLDEIAHAAGVARRTVYGHFPNRPALIAALARAAEEALSAAFRALGREEEDPATALGRLVLASWPVGDQYRMLISLGRRDLGEEAVRAALAPARVAARTIIERGIRLGAFASHLPAQVLTAATEAVVLAVLESQDTAGWTDPRGEAGAVAVLIAAGIPPESARHVVLAILDGSTNP